MNATLIRVYGTIAISLLVCLIFIAALVVAYVTKDQASQQLIVGAIIGQFSAVVSYFVGSSAGSAQKDEKLEPPPRP